MRILSKKTLRDYYLKYPNAKCSFEAWHNHFLKKTYNNFYEVKQVFGTADLIEDNTVIFNISGNEHRLFVDFNYQKQTIYIIWIGTHSEYTRLKKGNKLLKLWVDRKKRIEK